MISSTTKLILSALALGVAALAAAEEGAPASETHAVESAHDFTLTAIDGAPMPLKGFAGKTLLVVNTASLCGYTDQYGGLQALYATYQDRGLVVIGVPSNDFGGQEPGKAGEIKDFCETNFNVRFPLADKTVVRGEGAHPFYAWARETLGPDNAPKWNFHKYLVGPDGALLAGFPSSVEPTSARLKDAIERALPGA
ncbi:MAG: glutathione peroxidase [Pseudomonadota bacterium]